MPSRSSPDKTLSAGQTVPPGAFAAILRAVDSLDWQIGRIRLACLLKGRISHDMVQLGYTDNPYHGALAFCTPAQIESFIRRLIDSGYLHAARGPRPFLRVTLKGAVVLATSEGRSTGSVARARDTQPLATLTGTVSLHGL